MSGTAGGSFTARELRAIAAQAECTPAEVVAVLVGDERVRFRVMVRVRSAVHSIHGFLWPHWETDYRAALFRVVQQPRTS